MNIAEIVSQLKSERNRIDEVVGLLEGLSSNGASVTTKHQATAIRPKKRGLSAAGRKRLSEMMKKRWAERRKKAAAKK